MAKELSVIILYPSGCWKIRNVSSSASNLHFRQMRSSIRRQTFHREGGLKQEGPLVLALISDTRYRASSVQRVKKRRVDHLGDDARHIFLLLSFFSFSLLSPGLTTHPVRGFKDYFYFGTKKICLATRRRAHVPRHDDQDDDEGGRMFRWSFSFVQLFVGVYRSLSVFLRRRTSSSVRRKTWTGKGGRVEEHKIKANASPKRLRVALVYRWPEMVKRSLETALQVSCLPLAM